MNFFNILYIFLFIFIINYCSVNADSQAQEVCRQIHHVDADPYGTEFVNNNCRVRCNIHGTVYTDNINEGRTCLGGQMNYVCHNGECNGGQNNNVGYIDIEVLSASLYDKANAYATVCLKNSSSPVTLPLQDRRDCVSCSTNVIQNTNYPQWHELCKGSSGYLFVGNARVVIEVWNHYGTGNNMFLGGSTLTIDQLINHGDNHRQINLAMVGGHNPGQVTTRITWTPRK